MKKFLLRLILKKLLRNENTYIKAVEVSGKVYLVKIEEYVPVEKLLAELERQEVLVSKQPNINQIVSKALRKQLLNKKYKTKQDLTW